MAIVTTDTVMIGWYDVPVACGAVDWRARIWFIIFILGARALPMGGDAHGRLGCMPAKTMNARSVGPPEWGFGCR